jgi:hypothetical protein
MAAAVAVALGRPTAVRAQDEEEPAAGDKSASGVTLPPGRLAMSGALQIGLSRDSAFDPISIAVDLWYGINDRLQAGVVTSMRGTFGFWSGALLGGLGTGLCLTDHCAETFDNVGGEGHLAVLADGPFQLAAVAGLHLLGFSDPLGLHVKVGASGLYRAGRIRFGLAPSLFVRLTDRDVGDGADSLFLPVQLGFAVNPELVIGAQTGIHAPFERFGDQYTVPVALGGVYLIHPQMFAAGSFSLDRVFGGGDGGPGAFDLRSLNLTFGYML